MIGITLVSLITGFLAGVFVMNHLAVLAERDRAHDIETGTPIASELAREMKIDLGWN